MLFAFIRVDEGDMNYVDTFVEINADQAKVLWKFTAGLEFTPDEEEQFFALLPYIDSMPKEIYVKEKLLVDIRVIQGEYLMNMREWLGKWQELQSHKS